MSVLLVNYYFIGFYYSLFTLIIYMILIIIIYTYHLLVSPSSPYSSVIFLLFCSILFVCVFLYPVSYTHLKLVDDAKCRRVSYLHNLNCHWILLSTTKVRTKYLNRVHHLTIVVINYERSFTLNSTLWCLKVYVRCV